MEEAGMLELSEREFKTTTMNRKEIIDQNVTIFKPQMEGLNPSGDAQWW